MIWNPFDWTAAPFLTLYAALAALALAAGVWLRSAIGAGTPTSRGLNELELAYLAGGDARLGDVALLCLASAEGAAIYPESHKIKIFDQAPLAAMSAEPSRLQFQPEMTRKEFQAAVGPLSERVRKRLQRQGLCPTDEQMRSFRLSVLPLFGFLLAFGLIKVVVGLERNHSVGILVFLLCLTGFAAFALASRPTRTRAGVEALRRYRASHARSARAPLDGELLLAVALTGAVVLSGTAYASIYEASRTQGGDGGGGDGGGGCGGGGCGGCS